jgi:uncharacterized protein YbjQ (UPF0145 family)
MFEFVMFVGLVTVGYTVGSYQEKKHLKDLQERELKLLKFPVRANKEIYQTMVSGHLVSASVVIANDYFKTVAVSVKSFFGGQVRSQEALLDRARREVTLRLKEKAITKGAHEIIGFRMDTSMVDDKGVEVFVYGTAVVHGNVHT